MCAIAGLLRLNGQSLWPEAWATVKGMGDVMASRGPDGEGQWQDGSVCLGHRRLSIIDISGGVQPMAAANGRLHIVFNGEIYNYRELRKQLEALGARFHNASDTEVILAAYEFWGYDCLNHLEGMFAFALWDGERLFCARDHFGKKPFYYTTQRGIFAFASQINALEKLKGEDFACTLSSHALMRYLAYGYVPTPDTIYEEIKSIPPAHALMVEKGQLRLWRYWDLPAPLSVAPVPEPELEEKLRYLLRRAVSMRMISDVPLGVFLSGGIDSSIVAMIMAQESSTPIEAFSIGFTEASYDESRYATVVAEACEATHHLRILSADACADALPGIVASMDTPMADASCAPTWLLSALARENVTVALGGDGADELWAGYEHYVGYKIALWYNKLPLFIRKHLINPLAAILPASSGYINLRLAVTTFLQGAAAPDWLRVQAMLTALGPTMQRDILDRKWLNGKEDFLEINEIFAPTREQFNHWKGNVSPLARAFHVYCRQFLLDDILVKVDRCSMLHSLEVRAPFLDKQVSEFAASLPVSCKLRGFSRKYLLKRVFANILPPMIAKRNKRGFQIPVAAWLRGRLKPLLMDMASHDRLRRQGIFDPQGVHKLIEEHMSGTCDRRTQLWTFLVFQLWQQVHMG